MYRTFSLVLILSIGTSSSFAQKPPASSTEKTSEIPLVAGKTIKAWIKDLRHSDPSIRRDAIQAMPFFGQHSHEAVPELVHLLTNDFDVSLRINAAIVLMRVEVRDGQVPSVTKALVQQLKSSQIPLRYHAIVTIGRFGVDAKEAIPDLIMATRDQTSWELRQAACASLFSTGIDYKDQKQDQRAVSTMIGLLSDRASKVRLEAIMSLSMMGKIHHDNLRPQLLKGLTDRLLNDREHSVVVWIYFCLMINEPGQPRWMTSITNLMKKGDVPTKIQALRALSMLRRDAKPCVPDMAATILDPDPWVSATACMILGNLSHEFDPPAVVLENMKKVFGDDKRPKDLRDAAQNAYDYITKKKVAEPKK